MKPKGSNIASKGFFGLIAAQFLGAFNDNAYKLVVSLYIFSLGFSPQKESMMVSLAAAFFIIPFILFSTYSGWVSDKFSKKSVIVRTKLAEIIIMLLSFIAFFSQNIVFIFSVLFLMGAQSAFFSPSKYGILPEIVRDDELSRANGHLQMFTFIAIILGTAAGGILASTFSVEIYLSSTVFIIIAVVGYFASFFVQDVKPAKENKRLEINPVRSAYLTFSHLKNDTPLLLTIIAISFFWFVGALFQLNILIYGKNMMGILEDRIAYLMTTIAVGIGIGSYLAGRLSGGKIEFGLVPFGVLGMALFSYDLSLSYASFSRTARDLFLLGMASGFYIVPLTSYLQQHSASGEKGENIAFCNLLSFTGILGASGYLYIMSGILEVDPAGIFLTMSILILTVGLFVFKGIPGIVGRAFMWGHVRMRHSVTIVGREHVPRRRAALIVSNNVTFLDPLLIAFSLQRPVTFIVPEQYYRRFDIYLICKLLKAIPAPKIGTKDFSKVLYKARLELERGRMVCVFPEGGASGNGILRSFDDHLIRIARAKAPEYMDSRASKSFPIIPVYIDKPPAGFSMIEGFFQKRKRIVCFGPGLNAESTTQEVRQAISLLGDTAFKARRETRKSNLLHLAFIHTAKKKFFGRYIADSLGFDLSYGSALAATIGFSKKLSNVLKREERMVGVMMPTSCMATLLNFSIMMAGRVPVNLNYTAPISAINSAAMKCRIKKIFTSEKLLKKMKLKKSDNMVLIEEFFKDVDIVERLKCYIKALITPRFILKLKYKKRLTPDDVATVIFSSGSTGEPKGIMLTHSNILSNVEAIRQVLPLTKREIFMGVLPFFHSFGFTATLVLPAIYGFETVFHPNPVDCAAIGKMAKERECTVMLGTPTFLSAYVRKCAPKDFKTLRLVVAGAEKVKRGLKDSFHEKFGIYPLEGFGCTELSPVVSINVPDTKYEGETVTGMKSGSVGRPLPGVSIKIVEPGTLRELDFSENGIMLVKGHNVMRGYLGEKEMTDEAIKDGWYNTNDVANVDSEGFITITDRASRFSKIGGEMVPHIMIENAILKTIGSDDTVCVVTSVPDDKKGEKLVVLYTDLGMTVGSLWDKLNGSDLPKLWIPKKTDFKKVDILPMLGSGKLDLRAVKKIAREM